jgi:hypothetical protein
MPFLFNPHLNVIGLFICAYFTKLADSDHGNHGKMIGWVSRIWTGLRKVTHNELG